MLARKVIMTGFLAIVSMFSIGFSDVYHTIVLDGQNKIIPWYSPTANAFDNYLDKCWSWAIAAPKDANNLPISYLYCAWNPGNPPSASASWENDVGEKIPNWVESARLYYQYTGSMAALDYVKGLVDYSLVHGQTPSNHAWPDFPVGTSNAGDTEFRGFTGVWAQWDCHVDLAADIGWSLTTMYALYGDTKYRDKAIHVADVLASHIVAGNSTDSPWPYVINSLTGANKSRYAASWDGALLLFDFLIDNNLGTVSNYTSARTTLKNWLLTYPMANGKWVDGHSDCKIDGNTNLSTTCTSDMSLYMFDHPTWDPNFSTDAPKLIKWTEDNFVLPASSDGLAGVYYGAYIPAEQTVYNYRMGYQTARLGGQYAQMYAVNGDATTKDRAYRCLSYDTYMMQDNGQSSDGPTSTVGYWWSDCYGEATRMYYYGMGGVPEFAPPRENHILYSHSSLKNVSYSASTVQYTPFGAAGKDFLRLAFNPATITVNGVSLALRSDLNAEGYTQRDLGNGDYAVAIKRARAGSVVISAGAVTTYTITATAGSNGTIAPLGGVVVSSGSNQTFTISATSGYQISDVTVDGISVGAVSTYTFNNVTANHTINASFSVMPSGGGIIGYNGTGASTDYISDAGGCYINATRFQATANLNVTTIKAKVLGITGKYKCAIYSDNSGTPQTLLKESAEVTNPATGWQTLTLPSSQSITNGNYYWLAIWSNLKSTSAGIYCETSGATTRWTNPITYGAYPNLITTTGGSSTKYCIYAEAPASSNAAPTVASAASASPVTVTATTSSLSVTGADDGGEANLTYTWSATTVPSGASVSFSVNGTNAAKNTVATFNKAGSYTLMSTIKDAGNLTVTSSVNVTVNQTLTTITVTPATASVATSSTRQFIAAAVDQFGSSMSATCTWTVSGGGSINTSGLFTSGTTTGGPYTVTATSGSKNGTASVTVTASNNAPTVATAASANPSPVTASTTTLSVLGADDAGESGLIYSWATTGTPPAAVTFSTNGTNAAKSTTATFSKAGNYSFQVTIKDAGNLTATSSVNVTVNQTLTTITVTPATASIAISATKQFTASPKDQFGAAMTATSTWTVSGGGTINASGLFTAGATAGGPYTVAATSGTKSGTASVTVTTTSGGTLGNTVVGTANDPSGAGDINTWRFQAGTSFSATAMKINLASAVTGKMKLAIYSDNSGSTGTILMGTAEVTNPGSGWVTFTLTSSQSITSGTYYWLAVWSNANYTPKQAPTGGNARYITKAYGTWPTTLTGTQGPYSGNESIYAY